MGQKWSLVKKTRAGIENAQWFRKTKMETLRTSQVLPVGPVRKTFFDLPIEVVLDIAEYLPPSSLVSFELFIFENPPSVMHFTSTGILKKSQKARFGFDLLDHPLAKLDRMYKKQGALQPESMPTSHSQLHLTERLELLCMLDRDGSIPSSQTVCSGCVDTHASCSSLFSISSLAQTSSQRRCLGSAGSIWICPHRILDYDQAQIGKGAQESRVHEGRGVAVLNEYSINWPIMKATHTSPPSNNQVREALRPLTAHICPHLRLNDPYVSSFYFQDCRRLRWDFEGPYPDCQCSVCSPKPLSELSPEGKCEYCGTTFFFYLLPITIICTEALEVTIVRKMKRSWRCTDSAWIAQVTDPADFEEYESAWHATNAVCEGKFEETCFPSRCRFEACDDAMSDYTAE